MLSRAAWFPYGFGLTGLVVVPVAFDLLFWSSTIRLVSVV